MDGRTGSSYANSLAWGRLGWRDGAYGQKTRPDGMELHRALASAAEDMKETKASGNHGQHESEGAL